MNPSQGVPTPEPDEDGDDSPWGDEGEQRPETDTTSFPGSTEAPAAKFRPLDPSTRRLYAASVAKGAMIASGVLNSRMDPEGNSFIMEPDEVADIAEPASRLLARHAPLPGGIAGQATDLSDIVELLAGLVGYVMGAFSRRAAAMGSGMPDGTEGTHYGDYAGDVRDEAGVPGPVPAWPIPNMAPMVGAGS